MMVAMAEEDKRFYIIVGNEKLYLISDDNVKKGELHCNPEDYKKIVEVGR